MKLTETEHYAVANALRVAAQIYRKDADAFRVEAATKPGFDRTVRQFEDQAKIAETLADRFEEAA